MSKIEISKIFEQNHMSNLLDNVQHDSFDEIEAELHQIYGCDSDLLEGFDDSKSKSSSLTKSSVNNYVPKTSRYKTATNIFGGNYNTKTYTESKFKKERREAVNKLNNKFKNGLEDFIGLLRESIKDKNTFDKNYTEQDVVDHMMKNYNLTLPENIKYYQKELSKLYKYVNTDETNYLIASNSNKPTTIVMAHIDTVFNDVLSEFDSKYITSVWDLDLVQLSGFKDTSKLEKYMNKKGKENILDGKKESIGEIMSAMDSLDIKYNFDVKCDSKTYDSAIDFYINDSGVHFSGMLDNLLPANLVLMLAKKKLLNKNVAILFTTGEERGCIGSRYFFNNVIDLKSEKTLTKIINLDVTEEGEDKDALSFEQIGNAKSISLIEKLLDKHPEFNAHSALCKDGVTDDGVITKNIIIDNEIKNISAISFCLKLSGGSMHGRSYININRVFTYAFALQELLNE